MADVVTMGETMVLFVPETDGALDTVRTFSTTIGGAESNMAIGLARLGHRAAWFSHLGDDPFGHLVLRTIGAEGVDVSWVRLDPEAPTGVFFRERIPGRPPTGYYYRRGSAASRLRPADLPADLLRGARLFHCTGISPILSETFRATIEAAIDLARTGGVPVVFDPNLRLRLTTAEHARATLLPLLDRVDILLAGLGEMALLVQEEDPQQVVGILRDRYGIGEIVLKNGAHGALVAGPSGPIQHVEAVDMGPEVDPTGAGDAFNAGYLSGKLRGLDPLQAAHLGAVLGAHAVVHPGDFENLPTWEQVRPYLTPRP
ncbi:MAG: sugar kinase [Chloroflexota bacterium]